MHVHTYTNIIAIINILLFWFGFNKGSLEITTIHICPVFPNKMS